MLAGLCGGNLYLFDFPYLRVFDAKKKNQSGPRKNGNPEFPISNILHCDLCKDIKDNGRYVGYNHGNGKNPDLVYQTQLHEFVQRGGRKVSWSQFCVQLHVKRDKANSLIPKDAVAITKVIGVEEK